MGFRVVLFRSRVHPPMIETTSFRREADDARARPARKTGSEGISRDSKTMMISEPVHPRRTNAMKLDFIPLDKLSVSKANMRHGKKPPDISDILPTVRARGVIQPRSEEHTSELQSLMRI